MSVPKYINEGMFGKIIELEDEEGKKFALKVVKPGKISFVEIDILSRVKSPYLIRSLDPEIDQSSLGEGIKMELKENNLKNLNIKNLPPGQVKRIFINLLYGLECLHKSGFLHLDIKPSNCLYEKKNNIYTAYLSDFGFSMRCDDPEKGIMKTNMVGSTKYIDYSILDTKPDFLFNIKSDIWSMGVTFLTLLGFKLDKDEVQNSEEKNQQFMKKFWEKNSINKLTENLLEDLDMSELDKLDIFEMITQMLRKDRDQRISSRDFSKLRFYQKNKTDNSCYVSKPKEILYIPYSSPNVVSGINTLREFFKKNYPKSKKEVYFLSVEIFIRIMAKTYHLIDKKELEKIIQVSFLTSMNYYKEAKLDINKYIEINNSPYDIIKMLKGDIAPNKLYYDSSYVEDLILLDKIVLSRYNLISFYMYLNPESLFSYFRSAYQYQNIEKSTISTIGEFLDLEIPSKDVDNNIDNIRDIYSYKDFKSKEIKEGSVSGTLNYYRFKEQNLRSLLNKLILNFDKIEKYSELIKKISEADDFYNIYRKFYTDNKKQILYPFLRISNQINFLIISEDIFGKLSFEGDKKSSLNIFVSNDEKISLVVIDNKLSKAIHYYSDYNENLFKYYQKKNIDYSNEYKIKNPGVCKIIELCIVFLVYIIDEEDDKSVLNLDFFSLTDKTMKQMLIFSIIKNDQTNPEMMTF